MGEPKEFAAEIESGSALPEGDEERFFGYAVIGLPFKSGDILALRRFPASSIGPGYTSVWHRNPEGNWTFYQDALPQLACSRYFGNEIERTVHQPISIEWVTPRSIKVSSHGARRLEWQVTLRPTVATRLMNLAGRWLPHSWWQHRLILTLMGTAARLFLGTGKLRLAGRMPNGQTFIANPRTIWLVGSSEAVIDGRNLGAIGPLPVQGQLGDFLIPQRGIFAIASAFLESFDSSRHLSKTSKDEIISPV